MALVRDSFIPYMTTWWWLKEISPSGECEWEPIYFEEVPHAPFVKIESFGAHPWEKWDGDYRPLQHLCRYLIPWWHDRQIAGRDQ